VRRAITPSAPSAAHQSQVFSSGGNGGLGKVGVLRAVPKVKKLLLKHTSCELVAPSSSQRAKHDSGFHPSGTVTVSRNSPGTTQEHALHPFPLLQLKSVGCGFSASAVPTPATASVIKIATIVIFSLIRIFLCSSLLHTILTTPIPLRGGLSYHSTGFRVNLSNIKFISVMILRRSSG